MSSALLTYPAGQIVGPGPHHHVELILRSYPKGDYAKIWVKYETAEFFGWLDEFESYPEMVKREIAEGKRTTVRLRRKTSRRITGKECRIGRGQVMRRNEGGLTHAFRLGRLVTNRQLAELAHFTKGEWYWMEDVGGIRRTREQWLDLYARTP